MKKTININIAGQIFHVEEDAYEQLHQYLNEVMRYFSSFEDSKEILSDIESRIAELLIQKLGTSRQAVTIEDVRQVIAIMGTTSDFAREEEREEPRETTSTLDSEAYLPKGKLVRDTQRKLISGVLSGIAYYYKIDPFWVRLGVLALFFGLFVLPPAPGLVLLSYIVLWIVLPANPFLENQKVKKLFRNPKGKVIAGVCSGIAAYFKIDVVPVRLVFVFLIFAGGSGLIAYIIIWAISPPARTIADELEMEGSPVTLSTIEQTVKQRLQSPTEKEESVLVKVLLLPFRVLSGIFTKGAVVIVPIFTFLLQATRILFGIVLVAMGLSFMAAILAAVLAYFNLWNYGIELPEYFSLSLIRDLIPSALLMGASLMTGIPALALILLGIWTILARPFMSKVGVIVLSLLWVASVLLTGFTALPLANEFRQRSHTKVESFYPVDAQHTLLLDAAPLGDAERATQGVMVQIRGYEGTDVKLVQKSYAMGTNTTQAKVNASYLNLEFEVRDTTIVLPLFATLQKNQPYRGQHAELLLYIPFDQPFIMTESLAARLHNTLHYQGYKQSQADGKAIWKYDSTGTLLCMACPELPATTEALWLEIEEEVNSISAGDRFDLQIKIGDKPSVRIYSKDLKKEDISAEIRGGRLELSMRSAWGWNKESPKEILVEITTPRLVSLELNGIAKAEIANYRGESIEIEMNGGSSVRLNGKIGRLELNQNGATTCELTGEAEELEASVAGASRLMAAELKTRNVKLETVGASNAEVWADENLEIESSGVSHVQYEGSAASIDIEEMGVSRVRKRK